jgi:hypothetical protein
MPSRITLPRLVVALAATGCALVAGCAGLPRIDPTGERVFIWPKDQAAAAAFPVAPSNIVAPPVMTDPFFPQSAAAPVASAATSAVPGAVVPGVRPAAVALAQIPQDKLSITPERVLAPVGSEVVLKASVCTTEGYTLSDQKVEWMLGRSGVGHFVEVSGKGLFHPPLLPWNKPDKVDNYLATGWTANGPLCITRGTADPSDDVNINRGDAWVSISSPNEGTSYVSAYTPAVDSWEQRKSAATIYWVDVQWTFPPPNVASSGRPATLTTTVTRQTDGTPIEGWIVRYELADGGGTLSAAAGGQTVDVRTDAQGRATVEAAPTASGAASSQVNVTLIRPAGFGGGDAPQLVIGSGTAVISWTAGATPYLPPSSSDALPATPAPSLADGGTLPSTPGGMWTPPSTGAATPAPTVPRPQLALQVTGDGAQVEVEGQARFGVTVINSGNAEATGVVLVVRYDPGFSHLGDPERRLSIDYNRIGTLQPGGSREVFLNFGVLQTGQLCHDVTVSCNERVEATRHVCVTAVQPPPQRVGGINVTKEGPQTAEQGRSAIFRVTVTNTGDLPLVDIDVVDEYSTDELQISQVRPPLEESTTIAAGVVRRRIPRLDVGQSQSFDVECLCLQAVRSVIPTPSVLVTAQTDPPSSYQIQKAAELERPLQIVPAQGTPAAAGGGGGAAAGLRVDATVVGRGQVRVDTSATCVVTIRNTAAVADADVELRVAFPRELTPVVASIEGPPGVQPTLDGAQLRFSEIPVLAAGDGVTFRIPMNVLGPPGVVDIVADVRSASVRDSRKDTIQVEISR